MSTRENLVRLCAEAYQVIASLAVDAGRFDDDEVVRALDILTAVQQPENAAKARESMLPFPAKVRP